MSSNNNNRDKLILFGVMLIVAGGLVQFFWSRVDQNAPGREQVGEVLRDVKRMILKPISGTCESVVRTCELIEYEDTADCNKKAVVGKISERLADPVNTEECISVKNQLASACMESCPLDYDTLFVIPGKIQFDELPILPKEGEPMPTDVTKLKGCRVRGKRSVVFRGECRK